MAEVSASLLRLRPELEQSWQRHQGSAVLVVKDPVTRRYFRFTETQAAILELMAEPMDAEGLSAAATAKFGRPVSPATIAAFFNSLEQKLLVDTPKVRETLATVGGQKLAEERNFLYWKLTSFDPERIFNWLLPRTRWAFRPSFHIVAVLLFLTALYVFFANRTQLWNATPALMNLYGFFLILPMAFIVITIHEFAHGLTCRHFGGKVHEVGFMLIYFQPAFYCDVSDSWLFASTRNRMWVTFAGGYAQLIVWSLCTLFWRFTEPALFVNQAALAVVLFSGLQSLANFNPLIKLDGYYLLSDYLEIPNLRAKASDTLWGWVGGKLPKREGEAQRAIRAQLIYGALSFVFSTTLLVWVYSYLYTWSTSRYRLAGLVGFTMFSTYTLRKTAADSISGVRAIVSRPSVKRYRNLIILAAIVLIAVFGHLELKIPVQFRVAARDEQPARPETEGIVVEILARENMEVRKGDVLARTRDFEKQKRLTELTDQIVELQGQLKVLQAPPRPADLDRVDRLIETRRAELANAQPNLQERAQLEQTLSGRKSALKTAEADYDRAKNLFDEKLLSLADFQRADNLLQTRRSEVGETEAKINALSVTDSRETERRARLLGEAEAERSQLLAGPKPEEVKRRQQDIDNLEAQRRLWDRELKKADIVSPIDGVVITPRLEQKRLKHLDAGDEFCRIADIRHVTIEMSVPEKEMADVKVGFPVRLKPNTYLDQEIEAHVDSIPLVGELSEGKSTVLVKSEVENPLRDGHFLFKPETMGWAKIYAGPRRIIDLATRSVRQWLRTEIWTLF